MAEQYAAARAKGIPAPLAFFVAPMATAGSIPFNLVATGYRVVTGQGSVEDYVDAVMILTVWKASRGSGSAKASPKPPVAEVVPTPEAIPISPGTRLPRTPPVAEVVPTPEAIPIGPKPTVAPAVVAPTGIGARAVGDAPNQVRPGVRVLEGIRLDDLGRQHPWRAHYDEFGRLIARTDWDPRNLPGIPPVHHHTYRWTRGGRIETGAHIPGEYAP